MAENYKRHPNTKCVVCEKDIYKRPSQLKLNGGRAFCGQKCYGLFCRKEKPCNVCGKMILASANKKTCSRNCANINRAGIRYKINRPRDKVKAQQALKVILFRERGIVCERCGFSKREILQVHHRDRNRNNNEIANLELICPNCHYEEHHIRKK